MKLKVICTSAISLLCLLAVMFVTGCGGGGKSLDTVVSPTDNNAISSFTEPVLVEHSAADIGLGDTTFNRFFLKADGTPDVLIATSGATYVGSRTGTCAACHAEIDGTFNLTNHATAITRKVNLQNAGLTGGISGASCIKCHSVNGPQIPTVLPGATKAVYGSNGADGAFGLTATVYSHSPATTTAAINAYLVSQRDLTLTGIQCENCHGPASLHVGLNGAPVNPTRIVRGDQAMSASTCAVCHDAPTHHSKNQQWRNSGHSAALEGTHMAGANCNGCHSAEGFVKFAERLKADPTAQPYDSASNTGKTLTAAQTVTTAQFNVNCAACHDPHAATPGTGQLRVAAEKLCSICHRGRPNKAPGGSNSPHHNQQDLMLNGEYGVSPDDKFYMNSSTDFIIPKYAAGGTEATTLKYTSVASGIGPSMGTTTCFNCHVSDDHGGLADHSFKPKPAACVKCHSGMNAESVIGQIQKDFTDKYNAVNARLTRATAANTASAFTAASGKRKLYINAKFNINVVDFDGSKGIHNTAFANKLMEDASTMLTQLGY